jgi:hypothetical protein
MFAVTGITGKVRGVVARVLLAPGLDARGVVRDPVKGEDWANQGCEVVVAEMNGSRGSQCHVACASVNYRLTIKRATRWCKGDAIRRQY